MGGGHTVYWEESGTEAGVPALYLHGGPGGTLGTGSYRRKFDLDTVRLVGLDQRGCGRSAPSAAAPDCDLSQNTTEHLIADLEALREHLGIQAWLVSGVSWGSTLALAYARRHPQRVLGLVLMAVTTTSRAEVAWITEAMGAIFPETWEDLASFAEQAGIGYRRGDMPLVEAYRRLLQDPDQQVRHEASQRWALWEDTHVSLATGGVRRDPRWEDAEYRLAFCTLVTHYWSNHGFLDPPILESTEPLHGIPGTLIHGRHDVSGPVSTAWQLHRAWPQSELIVVEDEGHGGAEMVEHWQAANQRHVQRIMTETGEGGPR